MNAPRLVVRRHDPRRTTVRVVVGVVLAALVGWAVFAAGRSQAEADVLAARVARAALQQSEEANRELRERIAVVERSAQVERRAHAELRGSLSGLNDEILQLREELAFYRGIVSPADARRGLRIHEFAVEPGAAAGAWRYHLMLIQAMQHDREARGSAHLVVVGAGPDGVQRVTVADGGIPYDFRYFQGFDGDILLPDGFVPDRIEVELAPRSERDAHVEQTFDWPTATAGDGG